MLDAGRFEQDVLDLVRRLAGALKRRGVGQLQRAIDVALVFFGQETGRQPAAEKAGAGGEDDKQRHAQRAAADRQA